MPILMKADKLKILCQQILEKMGCPVEDAIIVADNMVSANLRGVDTHGVSRFPIYIRKIQQKGYNFEHKIKIVREENCYILIDGDNGLGQVVAIEAINLALAKARKMGVCTVLTFNTNYLAMLAYFMLQVVKHDMIGIMMCNTPPLVAPSGGIEARLGTNPLCVAVPTGKPFPIVLDMATTVAAGAKIQKAEKEGKKIPEGWALDKEGHSTTDPTAALNGVFLPVGGPKGYGLSLLIDVFSGVLTGANYGLGVPTGPVETGHFSANFGNFIQIINIEAFIPIIKFKERINRNIDDIKSCKKLPGVSEILIPGELEFRTEKIRLKEGIPVDIHTWNELENCASKLNINLRKFI